MNAGVEAAMHALSQADGVGEDVRQTVNVDIACVGFGPAMGGFLTTLVKAWNENPADPAFESSVAPGMPLQVLCYERADDLAAAVSGVVTRARGIRASFPDLKPKDIPMSAPVRQERIFYLLDPIGASRRTFGLRAADAALRSLGRIARVKEHAFELPWTPDFLHKSGGLLLSLGQFNQWVASEIMASGLVQIWPGTPVSDPLIADSTVAGVRLADQGVDKRGTPSENYMPGMDVQARLTVVGDGPVGAIGQRIDSALGMPKGHAHREWALGMKFVIELPESAVHQLEPGTIWHTLGFPEPEIFGFLYAHPDRLVSVGIFVPSWMHDPARTAYRYLQHFIQHPLVWRHVKEGTLRSWGAKSLEESGRQGEPWICGNGFARIGEGSGSTNVLTNSGVDEAWTTGVQLGESVIEILRSAKAFTEGNLAETYGARRRASWVERGAQEAEHARGGFQHGFTRGMIGMALAGLSRGRIALHGELPAPWMQLRGTPGKKETLTRRMAAQVAKDNGRPIHDALLSARGWPEIPFDGRLLVTHQDALLMGGKVQATPGFADHVLFRDPRLCAACEDKTCVAMCSGQAIRLGADGLPVFEREKCIHCGACLWNCSQPVDGEHTNIEFRAGSGGLHSAEN
jgi:electron-transferring-flavoprotein dehydrogenase